MSPACPAGPRLPQPPCQSCARTGEIAKAITAMPTRTIRNRRWPREQRICGPITAGVPFVNTMACTRVFVVGLWPAFGGGRWVIPKSLPLEHASRAIPPEAITL
jgi:hypothetical protein